MSILGINDLALDLVARDFSNGHAPSNGGPTKTSRALAIIHLAAYDAYAAVRTTPAVKLPGTFPDITGVTLDEPNARIALAAAGLQACRLLYPDDLALINDVATTLTFEGTQVTIDFGTAVGQAWVDFRRTDKSDLPLEDRNYKTKAGDHRPDPLAPNQTQHGHNWGKVWPFIISDIETDAPLLKHDDIDTVPYFDGWKEVYECGRVNLPAGDAVSRAKAVTGIFWGYDGANRLGTPPRLYLKLVRKIPAFGLVSYDQKVRVLTACAVAMADAGIAAWYYKYKYNLWRPVIGIRHADKGWGPEGEGDQNAARSAADYPGDPFWLPLGAPRSNPHPGPQAGAPGANFTPNFPAYPSGHSTFGSACFQTAAALLSQPLGQADIPFTSGEFDGNTTDNTGAARPKWVRTLSLQQALDENEESRIFLGVHWRFDATGGKAVGEAIADKVVAAF